MRLYINSKTKSVLYAEMGKDCLDFLLGLMSMPMAGVTRLLREHGMEGSLSTMYKSFENLNAEYIHSVQSRGFLLTMMGTYYSTSGSSVPPIFSSPTDGKRCLYSCTTCRNVYQLDRQQPYCPICSQKLDIMSPGNGYVKGTSSTYIVMDDLEIKPLSTNSSFARLNKYGITDIRDLEEREVQIGKDEVHAL